MAEPISPLPSRPEKAVPIVWPQSAKGGKPGSQHLQRDRGVVELSWQTARSWVSRTLSRAGSGMANLKRERPLEVIAGVAAGAFLLGVGIRTWRSFYE